MFDRDAESPLGYKTRCYNNKLARAIPENIRALEQFVDNIWMTVGESVYSRAFRKAFRFFMNSSTEDQRGMDFLAEKMGMRHLSVSALTHSNLIHSRFLLGTQIWYFCTKLTFRVLKKFQQKIKLYLVGIEFTTLTITGLEVPCLAKSGNLSCLASTRLSDTSKFMA